MTGLVTTLAGLVIRNAEPYEETTLPDKTLPHPLEET